MDSSSLSGLVPPWGVYHNTVHQLYNARAHAALPV